MESLSISNHRISVCGWTSVGFRRTTGLRVRAVVSQVKARWQTGYCALHFRYRRCGVGRRAGAIVNAVKVAWVVGVEPILRNISAHISRRQRSGWVRHEPIPHKFSLYSRYNCCRLVVVSIEKRLERRLKWQRETPRRQRNLAREITLASYNSISPAIATRCAATRDECIDPEDSIITGAHRDGQGNISACAINQGVAVGRIDEWNERVGEGCVVCNRCIRRPDVSRTSQNAIVPAVWDIRVGVRARAAGVFIVGGTMLLDR